MSSRQLVLRAALALPVLLAGACASGPYRLPVSDPDPVLERVAATARQMIGSPYRYGGHSPRGFDCSGLVFYVYGESGVVVPRTAVEQLHASRLLSRDEAVPGDLVFFHTKENASHVGIYLGGQWFVHAPSTGKVVAIDKLDDEYYQRHLIKIGRLDAVNQPVNP